MDLEKRFKQKIGWPNHVELVWVEKIEFYITGAFSIDKKVNLG